MLVDKYSSLIDMANSLGVSDLTINEGESVLHIDGTAPNADVKRQLWEEYGRLDPDFRAGDLVLNISNAGGDSTTTHTVQSGETLSKIGAEYGVSWQSIFEANKDIIDNPDLIYPGQELKIPEA